MSKPSVVAPYVRPEHTTKLLPFIDICCVGLIAAIALFIGTTYLRLSYDDAYITYRYSYNFAVGRGFVYNPGEWFMGTTAPLYGLILGVIGFVGSPQIIPVASGVLSTLSLLLTGVALYVYGRQHKQWLCGLLAGALFVSNWMLPATFGGEMLFQVALISWAFVLYSSKRTIAAAVLLAVAVLTRMDSAVALGVVGLHYLVTRRKMPWREMACVAVIVLPFALLSWFYYGSLTPATLDAKLAQRDSGLWPRFATGLFEWLKAWTMQGSSRIFPGMPAAPNATRYIYLVALGVPALLLFRFWLLPLAWVALYVLAYSALGVPFYHWYIVPAIFGLTILAACGIAGIVELAIRLYRWLQLPAVETVGLALSVITLLVLAPGVRAQLIRVYDIGMMGTSAGELLYDKAGEWLRANTPQDATVGYFEIGRLGYHADRTIIDPLGLVNPRVASHVAQGDFIWAYEHYRPDYIVHNQSIFLPYIGKVVDEPWFQQEYRKVAQVAQNGVEPLIIYKRQVTTDAARP